MTWHCVGNKMAFHLTLYSIRCKSHDRFSREIYLTRERIVVLTKDGFDGCIEGQYHANQKLMVSKMAMLI